MTLCALDLGSRHLAIAAGDYPPPRILAAATIDVDPLRELPALDGTHDRWSELIRIAADEAWALIEQCGATEVLIEWAKWHPMGNGNPGAEMAWKRAHDVMNEERRLITERCKARGIPVHLVNPRTWRFRVVPLAAHPDDPRHVSDSDVLAALPAHLDAASMRWLTDEHQRDAAGVMLGWLLRPEEKPKRERAPKVEGGKRQKKRGRSNPETVRAAAERARQKKIAAREASGCTCMRIVANDEQVVRLGKHTRECPAFVAGTPRGLRGDGMARAGDALDELFGRRKSA